MCVLFEWITGSKFFKLASWSCDCIVLLTLIHLPIIVLSFRVDEYFTMQILQGVSNPKKFWYFARWGHTGNSSEIRLEPGTLEGAIELFQTTFFEKTANTWDDRDDFHKYEHVSINISPLCCIYFLLLSCIL